VDRLRQQLVEALAEDAPNAERLAAQLDSVTRESGIGAHTALLLVLTRQTFEEDEARRHWEGILAQRSRMAQALGRGVGLRVALLDHFINMNRRAAEPAHIEVRLAEALDAAAGRDLLTGLVDDRGFRLALQRETRRARRYGQSVAVVLFDLDAFAAVNAAVGGLVADRLIRDAAVLLHNKIRDIDVAARPGEDELALVLPQTDRNGAILVAERFRREVEQHFAHRDAAGKRVPLTVSAGVAAFPEDAAAADALLERAAQALYQAKAGGKNTVRTYIPERRRFLRIDLEAGRFEVEVLAPQPWEAGRARRLSGSGIVFASPEPLGVGEEIEIRLVRAAAARQAHSPRIRGRVVRIEELPDPTAVHDGAAATDAVDRFEIGMAFDHDGEQGIDALLTFFEDSGGSAR
jgi:diguanylate cyclase (GGDEF)-like protein